MPREKRPLPDTSGEVPLWFVTYSDVITLMMTFFILLLTFATSEPETFEQMKTTFFGGQGATGVAGQKVEAVENDALVMRYRPETSRITTRGSEEPPINEDPHLTSLAKGLEGLDADREHSLSVSYSVSVFLRLLTTGDGELTPLGKQRMRMLARQLAKGTHDLALRVEREDDLPKAISMGMHLTDELGVPLGRASVGLTHQSGDDGRVDIILTRRFQRQ